MSQWDRRTDQGETDLDRDESKSAFEEESRRFNGEYFNIFTQNSFANENNKEEQSSSEDEYKPDFEVIEEEIHNTEDREDWRSSDIYSNRNSNSSNKKRTSIVPIHKFPTELEENPYLYYANKAKHKKIKNKNSIKTTDKNQKLKIDSWKSIESTSNKNRHLSTEQNDPVDLLKGNWLFYIIQAI